MNTFFYNDELKQIGLKSYGNNVLISRKVSIYNPELIEIGDYVRIDDFCILSGRIKLGSFIHISAFCALYGKYGIILESFTGISTRTTIYSAIDDFSGDFLIGPLFPDSLRNIIKGEVILERFVQIGANCVVFPNLSIGEGTVVGALSLVNKTLDKWSIYAGIPVKKLKARNNGLVEKIKLNYLINK